MQVTGVHQLPSIAREILEAFPEERIFALYGELGAGKTTLIKAFCKALGVRDLPSSPSFGIIHEYGTENQEQIYHFDFYRIEKPEELLDIGYEEYVYSGQYCFMEWPEKIGGLLPEKFVSIKIRHGDKDNERMISIGIVNSEQ